MSDSRSNSESTEMNRTYNQCVLALGMLMVAAEKGSCDSAECLREIANRHQSHAAIWERSS
jgi:hypothetical protein